MIGFIFLLLVAGWLGRYLLSLKPVQAPAKRGTDRANGAEQYAARLYEEKHYHAAEKAYLEVLKHDHRNSAAYTRLGIIYSVQHNFPDAIESFALAARFGPSASSFQHLGLAYLENKNYIKAIAAYEKAIMFEPTAGRYAGLSRALAKVNNGPKAMEAQEKAVELDAEPKYLSTLATLYSTYGKQDQAAEVRHRLQLAEAKAGARQPSGL